MQDAEQPKALNLRWMVGVGLAGLILIAIAVLLHVHEEEPAKLEDPFWQDVLLHVGAGLALSGVLFYFDRKFERVGRHIAEQTRAGLVQALDEHLDQRLGSVLARQDEDDDDAVRAFTSEGSFAALDALLTRATQLGTITKRGVRAAIPHTMLYLRVCSPNDALLPKALTLSEGTGVAAIECSIERSDRVEVKTFRWESTSSTDEVFLQLHDLLSQAGEVVNLRRFLQDAARLRDDLATTLHIAIESRTSDDASGRTVSRIYQRVTDDWFVTIKGLEQLSTGHLVSVDQLHRNRVAQPASFDGNAEEWRTVVDVARAAWRPNESVESFV
jgi:hypothetical protein